MHIDEDKIFDKRNVARNIRNGIISQKDYEIFLSKLPDASNKLYNPEETSADLDETGPEKEGDVLSKKKGKKRR
jgi:hypothetical protein